MSAKAAANAPPAASSSAALLGFTRDDDPETRRLRTGKSSMSFGLSGLALPPHHLSLTPESEASSDAASSCTYDDDDEDDDDIFSAPRSSSGGGFGDASTDPTTVSHGTGYSLTLKAYGDVLCRPGIERSPSSVDATDGSSDDSEQEELLRDVFLMQAGSWVARELEDAAVAPAPLARSFAGPAAQASGGRRASDRRAPRKKRGAARQPVVLHQHGGAADGLGERAEVEVAAARHKQQQEAFAARQDLVLPSPPTSRLRALRAARGRQTPDLERAAVAATVTAAHVPIDYDPFVGGHFVLAGTSEAPPRRSLLNRLTLMLLFVVGVMLLFGQALSDSRSSPSSSSPADTSSVAAPQTAIPASVTAGSQSSFLLLREQLLLAISAVFALFCTTRLMRAYRFSSLEIVLSLAVEVLLVVVVVLM